jgi:hypothetical protein
MEKIGWVITDGGRSDFYGSKKAGDCVIRAIAIVTGTSYKTVWEDLCDLSKTTGLFMNDKDVYVKYLESIGWEEVKMKGKTTRLDDKFFREMKEPVMLDVRGHAVALIDGCIHDTWDSRKSSFGDYYKVNRYYKKKS